MRGSVATAYLGVGERAKDESSTQSDLETLLALWICPDTVQSDLLT